MSDRGVGDRPRQLSKESVLGSEFNLPLAMPPSHIGECLTASHSTASPAPWHGKATAKYLDPLPPKVGDPEEAPGSLALTQLWNVVAI